MEGDVGKKEYWWRRSEEDREVGEEVEEVEEVEKEDGGEVKEREGERRGSDKGREREELFLSPYPSNKPYQKSHNVV